MLPVLAHGGGESSCKISLYWSPEDPGEWGLRFKVSRERRFPAARWSPALARSLARSLAGVGAG